ncbi:uncharacterized protein LOC132632381 isoform X2 [Lycium barbarum]|uniref:uncharacterized protein LOC132632381 isoform X2 n=1 Tax=Lycium barbarum TaxID=112863 RepID=UPI00293E1E60|nr:uncharacterized protein LOC132632381 isoform X2 [Lycium barbarum]
MLTRHFFLLSCRRPRLTMTKITKGNGIAPLFLLTVLFMIFLRPTFPTKKIVRVMVYSGTTTKLSIQDNEKKKTFVHHKTVHHILFTNCAMVSEEEKMIRHSLRNFPTASFGNSFQTIKQNEAMNKDIAKGVQSCHVKILLQSFFNGFVLEYSYFSSRSTLRSTKHLPSELIFYEDVGKAILQSYSRVYWKV